MQGCLFGEEQHTSWTRQVPWNWKEPGRSNRYAASSRPWAVRWGEPLSQGYSNVFTTATLEDPALHCPAVPESKASAMAVPKLPLFVLVLVRLRLAVSICAHVTGSCCASQRGVSGRRYYITEIRHTLGTVNLQQWSELTHSEGILPSPLSTVLLHTCHPIFSSNMVRTEVWCFRKCSTSQILAPHWRSCLDVKDWKISDRSLAG